MGGRGIGCMGLLNVEVWINFTPRDSRRLQTSRPPTPPRIVSFLNPNSNAKRELDPDPELELELELGPKVDLELDLEASEASGRWYGWW